MTAPRFLLVDDDALLLRSVLRNLRRHRPHWRISTAEGGAAALAELQERRYDVVVSDLEMPEVNGLDLLRTVKERYPDAVRVLYSGFANGLDDESVIDLYHLKLDKSATPEELVETLERARRLRPRRPADSSNGATG